MFFILFDRWQKNPSKIHSWANRNKKKKLRHQEKLTKESLSDALIWNISHFCDPEDLRGFKSSTEYASDLSIFEYACFVHYNISCWYKENSPLKDKDETYIFLLKDMVSKFTEIAGFENVSENVNNRLISYKKLNDRDQVKLLSKLIMKSVEDGQITSLESVGITDLHILPDDNILKSFPLVIYIQTFIGYMLPTVFQQLNYYYEHYTLGE